MSYIEDYVRGRAMSKNQKFAQQVFDKRRAEAMAPQAENIYGKPGYTHRGTPLRPGMTAPQMGTGVYNFNEKPEERYLKMQQRMLGTGIGGYIDQQKQLLQQMQNSAMKGETGAPAVSRSSSYKVARDMGLTPGTKPFNEFVRSHAMKSSGTTVNVGGEGDFLKPSDARSYVYTSGTKKGNHPLSQKELIKGVNDGLIQLETDSERKDKFKADKALAVVDTLEGLLSRAEETSSFVGENVPEGTFGKEYLQRVEDVLRSAADFANPEFQQYNQFAEGTLSPLVRAMGEAGALATEDVERAESLVPQWTDHSDVRKRKLKMVKAILSVGLKNEQDSVDVRTSQSDGTGMISNNIIASFDLGTNDGRPADGSTEWSHNGYDYKVDGLKLHRRKSQ